MAKAKAKVIQKKSKKIDLVDTDTNEVMQLEQPTEVDLWSEVMTKKDWIEKVEVQPTIVDTKLWKIHVKATANRWSFEIWKEYWISARVATTYEGLFEVIS